MRLRWSLIRVLDSDSNYTERKFNFDFLVLAEMDVSNVDGHTLGES